MNKKTGILAIVAVLLIAAPSIMAAPTKINCFTFTPAGEVNGGLQPGMYVVYNLPPLDVGMHVGQVVNGSVTVQEGTITDTNGSVLRTVPLTSVYFVSSPCQPGIPASAP